MDNNMNNNNGNTEKFDSKSETMVFNPVEAEKKPVHREEPIRKEYYYEENNEYEEYEDDDNDDDEKSEGNNTLIILVIVLCVLLIGAIVFGIIFMNGVKKEEEPATEKTEIVEEKEEEEVEKPEKIEESEEETEEEPEERKVYDGKIIFKNSSIELSDLDYTVRIKFVDKSGIEYEEKRYKIDSETKIKQDGSTISYIEFVNDILKNIDGAEVEFTGTIDYENDHIDYISFSSDILEPEKDSIEEDSAEKEESEETEDITQTDETTENTNTEDTEEDNSDSEVTIESEKEETPVQNNTDSAQAPTQQ